MFTFESAGQPGVMAMIVLVLVTLTIASGLVRVSTRGLAPEPA